MTKLEQELAAALRELHDWMREHAGYAESVAMLTHSHYALENYERSQQHECGRHGWRDSDPDASCPWCIDEALHGLPESA